MNLYDNVTNLSINLSLSMLHEEIIFRMKNIIIFTYVNDLNDTIACPKIFLLFYVLMAIASFFSYRRYFPKVYKRIFFLTKPNTLLLFIFFSSLKANSLHSLFLISCLKK